MFKGILKWLIKKIVNRDSLKNIVHKLNATLAEQQVDDRKASISAHAEEVTGLLNAYLRAYSYDGRVDEVELSIINADCDLLIDKYVTDEMLENLVEECM